MLLSVRHLAVLALPVLMGRAVAPLPEIGYHDNDVAAGRMVDGALTLTLEIRRGMWRPNGPTRPGTPMLAFAEPGGPLRLPGPMIRVPVGTAIAVTLRNTSDSTVVMYGLGDDPLKDSVSVAPGAERAVRFTVRAPGNRFYFGRFRDWTAARDRRGADGHLAGAIIVDAPGVKLPPERVLVLTGSHHSVGPDGKLNNDREIYVMNGRPWPKTRGMEGVVGDTLRLRVINATRDAHPMHLHGTYFTVVARGNATRDTLYTDTQRRTAVTELVAPYTSITMAWAPDRPGTWLMHCHLTFHVERNIGFDADSVAQMDEDPSRKHDGMEMDHHVEQGMGGLMMTIHVPAPKGWTMPKVASRRLVTMIIPNDSGPGDSYPFFAPRIVDGNLSTSAVTRGGPGATLFLHQGEPTTVRVINESRDHTAIHWHGMELQNYYDGVVGLGGMPGQKTRPIAPGGSFDAQMTPPRAGTFIYHTHLMEVRQAQGGLYGAMIVLPKGATWDAEHDHVFVLGANQTELPVVLNGSPAPPVISVAAGSPHRLRLINITTGAPGARFQLVRQDTTLLQWQPLAKDAVDLPAAQRPTKPAAQVVSMGETYDMLATFATPGTYRLEVRSAANVLFTYQTITVVPPAKAP